jgi:lipopolysaccharide export system permease protein
MLHVRTTSEHLMSEFHQRFASPLLAISYTLIGLAGILAGEFNRRGMSKRILIAALAVIAVQAAFMSMSGIVTRHIWMAFMLYVVALAPAPVAFTLLAMPSLKRRMMALLPAKAVAT